MKFIALLIACGFVLGLTGCTYMAPVMPPSGLAYANVNAPLDTDAEATPLAPKVGVSSSYSVAGLIAFGDCGLDAAARNGQLTKIQYIDYNYLNVLCVFQKFTTKVHGE